MTAEEQLKIQAFLDGELPEKEAREVAAWVARDAAATDLLKELRNTRQALTGFEQDLRVPESREFYWSKIEREMQRQQLMEPLSSSPSVRSLLHRFLIPASAVAALVVIGLVAGLRVGQVQTGPRPETEMAAADSGAFTYQDYANGTTLVWVNYPAER